MLMGDLYLLWDILVWNKYQLNSELRLITNFQFRNPSHFTNGHCRIILILSDLVGNNRMQIRCNLNQSQLGIYVGWFLGLPQRRARGTILYLTPQTHQHGVVAGSFCSGCFHFMFSGVYIILYPHQYERIKITTKPNYSLSRTLSFSSGLPFLSRFT